MALPGPRGRQIFEASLSGAQDRPLIPRLRSDDDPTHHPPPRSLEDFRRQEGREERKKRLRELWYQLPEPNHYGLDYSAASAKVIPPTDDALTAEKALWLKTMYDNELLGRCESRTVGTSPLSRVGWKEFVKYAEAKEAGK